MTSQTPQKYGFDTVFDGAGDIAFAAPRRKRIYSA